MIGARRGPRSAREVQRPIHGTTGSSRLLHIVGGATSRARTACGVVFVALMALIVLSIEGFPHPWMNVFHVVVGSVTVVMVFVIQHTQSREQATTQVKLNELLRALPQADDHLVHIEAASDEELIERERRDLEHHGAVRDNASASAAMSQDLH